MLHFTLHVLQRHRLVCCVSGESCDRILFELSAFTLSFTALPVSAARCKDRAKGQLSAVEYGS